jgi:hypothetical protein
MWRVAQQASPLSSFLTEAGSWRARENPWRPEEDFIQRVKEDTAETLAATAGQPTKSSTDLKLGQGMTTDTKTPLAAAMVRASLRKQCQARSSGHNGLSGSRRCPQRSQKTMQGRMPISGTEH